MPASRPTPTRQSLPTSGLGEHGRRARSSLISWKDRVAFAASRRGRRRQRISIRLDADYHGALLRLRAGLADENDTLRRAVSGASRRYLVFAGRLTAARAPITSAIGADLDQKLRLFLKAQRVGADAWVGRHVHVGVERIVGQRH